MLNGKIEENDMKLDECTSTTCRCRASKGSSIATYNDCMAIALIIQSCTSAFRQSPEHKLYMPSIRCFTYNYWNRLFNNSKSHRLYPSQPNLLGAGLLVPPNFNLVASVNFTILFLMFLPSLPMITLLAASLPGPKPLYTISSFLIWVKRPWSWIRLMTYAASWYAASYVPLPAFRNPIFPHDTDISASRLGFVRVMCVLCLVA